MSPPRVVRRSEDRHRIAVRVEAVALVDRRPVRVHGQIIASERRDEHDERRTRKMKVGDEPIDHPQPSGRPQKDPRLALAGAGSAETIEIQAEGEPTALIRLVPEKDLPA